MCAWVLAFSINVAKSMVNESLNFGQFPPMHANIIIVLPRVVQKTLSIHFKRKTKKLFKI